ncbi:30S ribosomal protein S3 [Candidatus Woesearchaeota archaeon]|nr:MAG: 30S ribosomal protein S3 [Candidatus Woesearchaeota archaeon]
MIERQFVAEKLKEFRIQEFIRKNLKGAGHSHTRLQRTPLGEKIIIYASRPGLVVGRRGENIKNLTEEIKNRFNLENPQIEINEVENINLDAQIVAERIANTLERFGAVRFKGIGHKTMVDVMNAGALGVEIIISGKIPSARAKSWRFYSGYLKKCGDIALTGVRSAEAIAKLKTGVVGIKVRIMPPETTLPDRIKTKGKDEVETEKKEEKEDKEEGTEKKAEDKKTEEKSAEKKREKKTKKSSAKKTTKKSSEKKADKK